MKMEKLLARLRGLLFAPRATWATVTTEKATPTALYRDWIVWLAAITPVSMFIGLAIFGLSVPFVGTIRVGAAGLLVQMLVSYVLTLAVVYLIALIAAAMSPRFGGRKDNVQALKLVAYAWAPVWVVGILHLVPALGALAALAALVALIYSIWLFWIGAQSVLAMPQERAMGFTAVVIVIGVVMAIAVGIASAALSGVGALTPGAAFPYSTSHRGGVPTAGLVNPAVQDAIKTLAPDQLSAFLPTTVDGMARGPVSTFSSGMATLQISNAKAHYGAGAQSIEISITDLAPERAMLAMASAIQKDQNTATGYDKIFRQDGNTVMEHWVANDRYGTCSVIVADRFKVKVTGNGPDMATLQKDAQAVDLARLATLSDSK
ncbi:membrane protein containing DUF1282 [mine drainage metagenome]|uniref:Membrane protein containing DUF1282 n=3 Tax=mine drainage metagenome TaxID=410659 RepID=T0Z048_9ZZZZ